MFSTELSIRTSRRTEMIDVTRQVSDAIRESGMDEGLCVVYVPHTTAGIMINEGADPAVARDIADRLEALVPWSAGYAHLEGNAAAHIKSCMVGSSVTVAVREGRMALGTWQSIFFCEFDGPRSRRLQVHLIEG